MIRSLIAILMLLIAVPVSAQNPDDGRRTAVSAAFEAARKAMTRGPATIAINDQAQLRIAEGEGFVPRKEADATMVALGNMTDATSAWA